MPDSVLHSGFMELLSNVQRIRALCARKLISYCPTSLSHKTSVLLHCFTLDLLMHMHVQGINVFPEMCKVRSRVSFACDLAMAWWSRSQLDQWWQNEDQDDGHTARRSFAPGPKRSMRPPLPPVAKFVEGRARRWQPQRWHKATWQWTRRRRTIALTAANRWPQARRLPGLL